jgi:hypothetical protein
MIPVGFELTISVGERLQTYFLDRPATGTYQFFFTNARHIFASTTVVTAAPTSRSIRGKQAAYTTLQTVATFHKLAMQRKTYAVRTVTPKEMSLHLTN